jgi:hypothetical protein
VIDPLGFALENFDGVGEWRVKEPAASIDASASWQTGRGRRPGRAAQGAAEDTRAVRARRSPKKLMTYALGRGVEYYDMPLVAIDRARRGAAELPFLVGRVRHREEHAVHDEEGAGATADRDTRMACDRLPHSRVDRQRTMFITKKHLPRGPS